MIARDPAVTKEHHEVLWNAIVDKIESLTAAGETDIARIIPLVAEDERREMGELDESIAKIFSVPKDETGVPRRTLVAVDGKYRFVPPNFVKETLLATVLSNLTGETDLVVELGSGWGRNLFNVYLRCRHRDLRFVACEPADAGRRATELLCALEDGIPFAVYPFTYIEPDLSFLEGRPNVLFFTNHSIEQVTFLDPRLFDLMLERTGHCTCVHAEPIGWQRHTPLARMAEEIMRTGNFPDDKLTFDDEDFAKNAALCSWKRGYNIDLLAIIDRYQRAGKINIKRLEYDFWGANPFIPATLVVWEKAG